MPTDLPKSVRILQLKSRVTRWGRSTAYERVEQMLEALKRITAGKGSSMFLFTDEAALAASNPLDIEWMSGKGEFVRLID